MSYVIEFLGAGVGGALRHGVNILAARLFGIGFPFGTLAVNIVGMALVLLRRYAAELDKGWKDLTG